MNVTIKKYKKNSLIFLGSGQVKPEFYIVKKGQIKIIKKDSLFGDNEFTADEGYIFGIIQCITGITENITVEAVVDCEIITIAKNQIEQVYADSPSVIMKILSEYSGILRDLDIELVKHDFFYSFISRDTHVIEIATKYLKINEQKKAAHLLKSYLSEEKRNMLVAADAQKILNKLPDVPLMSTKDNIETKVIPPNTVIFTELELGDNIYIITKGKVKITKLKENTEMILAILTEGSIFGEMSIINDKPRNATAMTQEVTEVMIVKRGGIKQLPANMVYHILEHLTHRIWFVQNMISCLLLTNPLARIYYFLVSKVKQNMKEKFDESKSSFVANMTLNELLNMTEIDSKKKDAYEEFLNDHNITICEDSIKIRNIKLLIDKNNYYYSRNLMSMNKLG